jgi:PAS domain S-box-containing protein
MSKFCPQEELLIEIKRLRTQLAETKEHSQLYYGAPLAQEQVTTILESFTDAFFMFDHMWKVIYMNQKAEQFLRINRDDLIGKVYWDVFPDAVDTISYRELHRAMAEQVAVSYEQFYSPLNMWFEIRVYPSKDGISVFFMDITEHKRTEKSVSESEKKFKAISSSAKDAIIMMDYEGNISYWNEAAEKIFGYSVQEALGKELHIFLAPKKYHDAYRRGIPLFKATGCGSVIGKTLELEAVRKDGTWFPIELSVSAVKIEEKWHATGIVRDITQRKKAEQERETLIRELQDALAERSRSEKKIQDLQHYNRGLIEASLDPLLIFDQKGIILDVNEAAVKATGTTRKELIGTLFADYFTDPKKAHESAMLVFEKGEVRDYELVMKSRDGTKTIVAYNASIFKDQTGQVVGAFAAARDITESKRVEYALHSQIELEKLIAEISTNFITSPSEIDNEINNALKAIGEFSGVDRSCVFQFYDNGKKMNNTHEWCNEDIEPLINILQGISIEENYPNFAKRAMRSEVIHVPNVNELHPEARCEKENLQKLGIKSLIFVPIVHGQIPIGILVFASVKTEKTWKEDDIRLLKMAGEIFANALVRKKAQQELEETIERLEIYTTRVNSLMVTMLGQATDKQTNVVIVDISGIAADVGITEPLVNLARLSRLLGATCIVTGIKSEAVHKLADLGVSLAPVTTERSLKEGLRYTIAIVEESDDNRGEKDP